MDGNMAVTELDAHLISVTPSYRRNGKLFSCEPCRRGKLRCDHNSPVCGRCARRNKPDQCVYHPAPLTKARTSPTIGPRRTTSSSASSPKRSHVEPYPTVSRLEHSTDTGGHRGESHSAEPSSEVLSSLGQPSMVPLPLQQRMMSTSNSLSNSRASSTYASNESAMSHRDTRTGFLGPTSFSAVYTENPSILEPPAIDESHHLPALSAEKIQQGAEVLSMLRDLPIYRKFCERWFDVSDGIMVKQPIFQVWADELWDQFGPLLTEGRPDQLRALSEQVWRNTRRPMDVNANMSAREWARSSSGQNLRWEVVGCLMTLVGLIACSLSNWDGIFDQIRERYVDRATFSTRMRKASEFCLCFCYESEVLNDIYLCFIYEDLVLVELVKGDAHYASWQRLGEVCDAVVAMGLHQGNYPDAKTPFWLAEMRKKIFTSAYGHDKVLATFFGRPPRLSHRYCKMEPPLDLSDEQLLSEGEELRLAIENLDADGWNTSGHLHRITWGRVLFYHNRLREDILEIALGSGEEDIVSQVDRVRAKIDRTNDPIPDFMKVTPERFFNASIPLREHAFPTGSQEKGPRQIDVVIMLCFQTGMAHTEFLLQRALVCRLKTDSKQLIPVSRRMLQLTLLAHSKRELFRDFQADLIYLLALHGLPAAGVLAVELLKQEQTKQYTPALLPRSETVQDLSVFISALAAVGPGEGNFSICDQGRRALKKVLDQILSPTMTAPPMQMPDGLAASVDEGGWGFPIGNDADFLSWLDNVEWDKRDWGEPALVNGVVNGL